MIQKKGPQHNKDRSIFFFIYQKGSLYLISVLVMFILIAVSTTIIPAYRLSSASLSNWTSEVKATTFLYLLGMENKAFKYAYPKDETMPKLQTTLFHLATSIKTNDPRSLFGNELPGFSAYGAKIIVAGEGTNYTNLPVESSPPLEEILKERKAIYDEPVQDDANKTNTNNRNKDTGDQPTTGNRDVVLLYSTHNTESFMSYLPDVKDTDLAHHNKVNITKVGERLAESLEANGIGTHVDHTNIANELSAKGWNYSDSYKASRKVVQEAMSTNKDLQYMFDIHRDGNIAKKDETKKINGKNYARIIFVVGANYDNYQANLDLAAELNKRIDKQYPGLSRGVIAKKSPGSNGIYNQDLSNHALLIEFGGVHSNFDELYRTADAVADVFSEFYWDAEKVNAKSKEEE